MTLTIEVWKSATRWPPQRWSWRARAANGRIVATSGENYVNRADCIAMAHKIFEGTTSVSFVILEEGAGKERGRIEGSTGAFLGGNDGDAA